MPKRRANGEGSIYPKTKDKNGKVTLWAAQYTDNIGKKRTLYGKTQQIVKEKLKEAIRMTDKGIAADKSKVTLAEWLTEWLEVYARPTIKGSTYSNYYTIVYKHILPAFPNVALKDLRVDMLRKFFNEKAVTGRLDKVINPETGECEIKQGGLQPGTLKRIKILLMSALDQAVDDAIIMHNVAKKIKLTPAKNSEVSVLSVDSQRKLEAAVMKYPNHLAFCVLLDLYTGLRLGELTALKIEDIDFKQKELHVRRAQYRIHIPQKGTVVSISEPKTEKGRRTIPLPDFIMDMLNDYIRDRNTMVEMMADVWNTPSKEWVDEGYLFVTQDGTRTDTKNASDIFQRILKQAGIPHIKFHALRHTFATRCLEAGFDIKSLSDILGHSDAKVTLNTYAHALPDQKRNNMNKLSMFFDLEN